MNEKAESIVQIDEHRLDKECIRLPGDYLKYATLASQRKAETDQAKAAMEVEQAELAGKIRQRPQEFEIEKLTEGALSAAILLQPSFQAAQSAYFEAKSRHEMTMNVVWALEHKKRSLTLLVDLHGMGYFSSPKLTKEGQAAVEEMTQKSVRRRREDVE